MQRTKHTPQLARIRIIGVGAGGRTAVNDLMDTGTYGAETITIDTDSRSVEESKAHIQLRIGHNDVLDNGTAGKIDYGNRAAKSARHRIGNTILGSDLVFVIAGLGGGTGSGAAPVIAEIARKQGALVIGIVTYPFHFEGRSRLESAQESLSQLRNWADTLIVIPNDRLWQQARGAIGFHEVYRLANRIWRQSVQGICELVGRSGLINVDFADVRSVMAEGGEAIIASGQGHGKDRAAAAAKEATRSDLLGISIDGAAGLLFNISGGSDLSLLEIEEAAAIITEKARPQANVIFGAAINQSLINEIHITVVATGFRFTGLDRTANETHIERLRPGLPGQPWKLESDILSPGGGIRDNVQ